MHNKFVNVLVTLSICLWTNGARADLLPTKGLTLYREYRNEILNLGWKPKPSIDPTYIPEWPEVICGNQICSAIFISPNKKEMLEISIWFDVKPGRIDYYVAPSFEIIDCPSQSKIEQCN